MSDVKSIAILGAGGNVGEAVLAAFQKTNVKLTVISRPDSKSTFPEGTEVVKIDLKDKDALISAFKGHEVVLSLVGSAALADQHLFVDAAVAAGVKYFVPSEFGHDTTNPTVLKLLPIFATKVKVVEYLQTKEKEGLSWVSVITCLFFDWGLTTGFMGYNAKEKKARIWDGGDVPFCTINVPTIAKALVSIFTDPAARDKAKNQYVFISSVTTTQNEILAAFEKETGEKWTVEKANSKEVVPKAQAGFASGDFSGLLDLIKSVAFAEGGLGDFTKKAKLWDSVLLPDNHETVEETVKKVLGG